MDDTIHYGQILEAVINIFRKAFYCDTEESLSKRCLEVAEDLTASKFGFIGEINSDNKLDTIAMSNPGWDACSMNGKRVRLINNMEIKGLWALPIIHKESVISNDPFSHPDSVGVPEGHPELKSFIGTPLFQNSSIIGVMALANKEGGYTEADKIYLEKLSVAVVESLMRKRAEIKLKRYTDRLEKMVAKRTKELEKKIDELEQRDKTLTALRDLLSISQKIEDKVKSKKEK